MAQLPTITVAMPAWQQRVYRFAPWLCLLAFMLIVGPIARRVSIPIALFLLLGAMWGAVSLAWYQRRIIADCRYDGCTLQFSTVGRAEIQIRPTEEIAAIEQWRETRRGQLMGYQLVFRDTQKVYLSLPLEHACELISRIEADRWPEHPQTL